MLHHWTINTEPNRLRLDVFITEQLPEQSRSHIAKLLKHGAGKVNNKVVNVHHFLSLGDVIDFEDEVKTTKQKAETKKTYQPLPPLEVIEATPDWVVINKPSGVIVHPDGKEQGPTLVDALIAYDPAIAKIGEDPTRPGIMHRLDKEASGLMVIARTQLAFENLKKQFAEHSVEKRYIALVYGEVREDEGEIKFRIGRSTTKLRMAAIPENEKAGKAAWTHFKTVKRFHNASLLELDIFSGRTHQIRAHLLAFSHPIIGDPLYIRRSEDRNIKAPRLMLQCIHLRFNDPATGTPYAFDLAPAPEFATVMKQLS